MQPGNSPEKLGWRAARSVAEIGEQRRSTRSGRRGSPQGQGEEDSRDCAPRCLPRWGSGGGAVIEEGRRERCIAPWTAPKW
jgi:hypothetical protein